MDAVEVITSFKKGLELAGLTPREVSPLVGMSHTTLYRIVSGRAPTSKLALRAMQMFTKFLSEFDPTPIPETIPDEAAELEEKFEYWLITR